MKGQASYKEFILKYPESHQGVFYMPVINLSKPNYRKLISNNLNETLPIAYEFIFKKDTASVLKQIKQLKQNGSRVWVNSLWSELCAGHQDDDALTDANRSYGWLVNKGFNMIQTDRPNLLLKYLRNKNLHK